MEVLPILISAFAVALAGLNFFTKRDDNLVKQQEMVELKARVGRLEIQREEFIRLEGKVDSMVVTMKEIKEALKG